MRFTFLTSLLTPALVASFLAGDSLSKAIDRRGAAAMAGDLFGTDEGSPAPTPSRAFASKKPKPKASSSQGALGGLFDLPSVNPSPASASASKPAAPSRKPASKPVATSGAGGSLFDDLPPLSGSGGGNFPVNGKIDPTLATPMQHTEASAQEAAGLIHSLGLEQHVMNKDGYRATVQNSAGTPPMRIDVSPTVTGHDLHLSQTHPETGAVDGHMFHIGPTGMMHYHSSSWFDPTHGSGRGQNPGGALNFMRTMHGSGMGGGIVLPDPEFENLHPRGQGGRFSNKPKTEVESENGNSNSDNTGSIPNPDNGADPLGQDVPGQPEGQPSNALRPNGGGWKPENLFDESPEASGAGGSHDDRAGGGGDAGAGRGDSSVHPDSRRGGVPGHPAGANGELTEANGKLTSGTDTSTELDSPPVDLGLADVALSIQQGPRKSGSDYHITDQDELGVGGDRTKYRDNLAAIRLLKQLDAEGRMATPEEQSILVRYTGWGWTGNGIFAPANEAYERMGSRYTPENAPPWCKPNDWYKQYQELKELLTEEEFKSANESITNAHYTSDEVCTAMWDIARQLGFQGGRMIEPGSGIGNFIGTMPRDIWQGTAVTGVEMDKVTARIAGHLYQSANIVNAPYQDTRLADGFFDFATGNVPFFEDAKISDPEFETQSDKIATRHLHNFFFAKTLKKLREDGVMMLISTNGTLDSRTSGPFRKYLDSRAEFLGAIRLPNNAFKENAKTEVVTDIVLLRKRKAGEERKEGEHNWTESVEHTDEHSGKKFWVNPYFIDHPEMVMGKMWVEPHGMYRGDTMTVDSDGRSLGDSIREAADKMLPHGILTPSKPITSGSEEARAAMVSDAPLPGSYVEQDGKLSQWNGTSYEPLEFTPLKDGSEPKHIVRLRSFIPMKKSARDLLALMAHPDATDEQVAALQVPLRGMYNNFVKKFGVFHTDGNIAALHQDPDLSLMLSMEKQDKDTKQWHQGDFLTTRVLNAVAPVTRVDTAEAALYNSLAEYGVIDQEHMQRLMPGRTADNIMGELEEAGHVFHNPVGQFEAKDEYLSGSVRQKLAQAKAAAEQEPRYQKNVEALAAVVPKDLAAHEITANLGAGWIPSQHITDFINEELLGVSGSRLDREGASAKYLHQTGDWVIKAPKVTPSSSRATTMYGTPDMNALVLAQHALSFRAPKVTYKDDDGSTHTDKPASQAAQKKVEAIRARFKEWLWSDPERSKALEGIYNEQMNGNVERRFNGQHLTLPGLSEKARGELNSHIKDCVWRSLQSKNTLHAVVVGGGKSWIKIISAMEMKRLGLCHKPMITVPNHVVPQMAAEFKNLYPNANILMVTKKDFSTEGRRNLMAKIATGNWDAVIIAHSQFSRIPVLPETQAQHYQKLFNQIDEAFAAAMEEESPTKAYDIDEPQKIPRNCPTAKMIAKAKARWKETLKKKGAAISKQSDGFIPFEHLGVDQLLVDEAHEFKNLPLVTTLGNMKGIPAAGQGSNKAFDMLMKARYVQGKRNGGGLIFATGTPIANSIAEMFVHMHFLAPEVLEQSNMNNFDSWIKAYSEPKTTSEITASGQTREVTRFSEFSNVPEMSAQFRQVAQVLSREDLPSLKTPSVKRIPVACEQDAAQDAATAEFGRRADAIVNGKPLTVISTQTGEPIEDSMLKICADARKNLLDGRLFSPGAEFNPSGKIGRCVDNMYREWQQGHETEHMVKGQKLKNLTQLAFMDMGTPKASDKTGDSDEGIEQDADTLTREWADKQEGPARDFAQEAHAWLSSGQAGDMPRGHDFGVDPEQEQSIWDEINKRWEGDDSDDTAAASLYGEMKQRLVDRGIPESQIAFIHDAKNEKQKLDLSEKVKNGEVRILLGSTQKMGTGLNVQDRLKALHHLDCPWRPCDLEQREGRIIRQGNANPEVNIYTYLGTTKGGIKLDDDGNTLPEAAEDKYALVHKLAGASDEDVASMAIAHKIDSHGNEMTSPETYDHQHRVAAASLLHHYKDQLGRLQDEVNSGAELPGAKDLLERARPSASPMAMAQHHRRHGVENALMRYSSAGMGAAPVPFTPFEHEQAMESPMPEAARGAQSSPTMDAFLWQMIERKQHCANQVMHGDATMRTVQDVSDDAIPADQFKAISSGSPLQREKTQLERELSGLESDHATHRRNTSEIEHKVATLPGQIARSETKIGRIGEAIDHREAMGHLKDKAPFHADIMGTAFDKREDGAQALFTELEKGSYDKSQENQEYRPAGRRIGTMFGFDLAIKRSNGGRRWLSLSPDHGKADSDEAHRILVEPGNTSVGTVERIRGELKRLDVAKDSEGAINERAKRDLDEMSKMNTEFAGNGRMGEIHKRLGEIDDRLLGRRPKAVPASTEETPSVGAAVEKAFTSLEHLLRGAVVRIGGSHLRCISERIVFDALPSVAVGGLS